MGSVTQQGTLSMSAGIISVVAVGISTHTTLLSSVEIHLVGGLGGSVDS